MYQTAQMRNQGHKTPYAFLRCRRKVLQNFRHWQYPIDRKPQLGCAILQFLITAHANATLRLIDNPAQAQVIIWVYQQAQIGQRVLNFLALVKLHATINVIRIAIFQQSILQHAGLSVRAINHRKILVTVALFTHHSNGFHCKHTLRPIIRQLLIFNQFARRRVRPQRFRLALGVVLNNAVCRVQNIFGATIILFQFNQTTILVIPLKIQNIANIRTAPTVNALVRVANRTDIAAALRQ